MIHLRFLANVLKTNLSVENCQLSWLLREAFIRKPQKNFGLLQNREVWGGWEFSPDYFCLFSLKKGKKMEIDIFEKSWFVFKGRADIVKKIQKSSILDLNYANISILKVILIDNNHYLDAYYL